MLRERFEDYCDHLRGYLASSPVGLIAPFLALFAYLSRSTGADPDLFARIAMGRMVELLGAVPGFDPFSYTAQHGVWIDHEWLSGVVFYFIAQRFGDFGLYLFAFLMACYSFVFLFRAACLETGQVRLNLFFISTIIFGCSVIWLSPIRSQIFTYFFLPYLLHAIKKLEYQSSKRWILTLPIVMFIWANAHGGFVTGLGLLWVYLVIWVLKKRAGSGLLGGVAIASTLSVFINPYGTSYLVYILHAVTMSRPNIPEWWPLSLSSGEGILTFSLVLCTLIALRRNRQCVSFEGFVIMGVCLSQALSHFRLSPIFFMTFAVYGSAVISCITDLLRTVISERLDVISRAFSVVLSVAALFGLFCFARFLFQARSFQFKYDGYPVAALCWLKHSGLSGKILVDFNQGSFALWRLYPEFLVSLDGRYEEVYSDEIVSAVDVALSPGRADFLESLKLVYPDYILLDRRRLDQQNISSFGPEWRELYVDETNKIITNSPAARSVGTKVDCDLSQMWVPGF